VSVTPPWTFVLIALACVTCVACGCSAASQAEALASATDEARRHGVAAATNLSDRSHELAHFLLVDRVRASVHDAIPAQDDPDWIRAALLISVYGSPQGLTAATALARRWKPDDADDKAHFALLALWTQTGQYAAARDVAFARAGSRAALRQHYMHAYYDAFEADPELFAAEVMPIEPSVHADRLHALGGGSTVSLRATLDDATVAAVKPNQTRLQTNYRGEIASYRLCALIFCGFDVPRNQEVRILERDFMRMYGIRSLENNVGYAANFEDLVWNEVERERWLHATWKDWVPDYSYFPIENVQGWEPFVSRRVTAEDLASRDANQALNGLSADWRHARSLREHWGKVSAFDLAHQISNLHVFDYLSNNWDRYSGAYPGVNCHFSHGRFVSIDNGATFQASDYAGGREQTTRGRLSRVHVFSRSTIDAIRWMDVHRAVHILLPQRPYHNDKSRIQLFLERRERLLEMVDAAIAERGEDAVLIFP